MELSDEMLTEISYVQISKYREKVMKSLEGDVKIPSQIAKYIVKDKKSFKINFSKANPQNIAVASDGR